MKRSETRNVRPPSKPLPVVERELVLEECPQCSGSGEDFVNCQDCTGTGYDDDGHPCKTCRATGQVWDTCPVCDGDGEVVQE